MRVRLLPRLQHVSWKGKQHKLSFVTVNVLDVRTKQACWYAWMTTHIKKRDEGVWVLPRAPTEKAEKCATKN
jgi:hypothetical protein